MNTINISALTNEISDRDLERLCADNPETKFETTPEGKLIIMSPTDDLIELQQKMNEYMDCGIRLGWLINPDDKQVEIYRIRQDKQVLNNFKTLSGENILPKLIVDLSDLFLR